MDAPRAVEHSPKPQQRENHESGHNEGDVCPHEIQREIAHAVDIGSCPFDR
jgi:hypothetical protein